MIWLRASGGARFLHLLTDAATSLRTRCGLRRAVLTERTLEADTTERELCKQCRASMRADERMGAR